MQQQQTLNTDSAEKQLLRAEKMLIENTLRKAIDIIPLHSPLSTAALHRLAMNSIILSRSLAAAKRSALITVEDGLTRGWSADL